MPFYLTTGSNIDEEMQNARIIYVIKITGTDWGFKNIQIGVYEDDKDRILQAKTVFRRVLDELDEVDEELMLMMNEYWKHMNKGTQSD